MATNPNLEKECLAWYVQNKELYNACGSSVQRLLTTLLEQAQIPVHSIQYRIKEQHSFLDKCMDTRYTSPVNEITDVCGLRVITYTNKDVEDICSIIEKHFCIDWDNSVNKADRLDANEVGYLSVHYIAKLNDTRARLEEYMPYSNIRFEIQVRTLLQHAWAEIEHDRSYKFSGELPKDIKRRFFLVAGTLELMDREFNLLAQEIEQYAAQVHAETKSGNLEFDIDSTSLLEYLKIKLKDYPQIESTFNGRDKVIIQELFDCGISTLNKLDGIMDDSIIQSLYGTTTEEDGDNYLGLLRGILMATMPEEYFTRAWKNSWGAIESNEYSKLISVNPKVAEYKNCFDVVPSSRCI